MPCNAMQQYPVHHYDHRMTTCLVGAKSVLCTLWQSWTSTTLCLSNFWSHLMLTMTSAFPYWMYMLTIVFLCRFSFYFPSNKQLFHFFFLITWPKNCICFCLVVISISSCICLQQDVIIVCLTLSPFIRPFFRWTWVSRYQNVSILLELRVMEVVVMTGVLDYKMCKAPVKSSPPTNQYPVFTGQMPFLSPNQQWYGIVEFNVPLDTV